MKVVFRVDASYQIGSGHVMRCLTLAQELIKRKVKIYFVCRNYPGNMISFLKSKNIQVFTIPFQLNFSESSVIDCVDHLAWLKDRDVEDANATIEFIRKYISDNSDDKPDWIIVDHYSLDHNWEKLLKSCVKKIMVIDDTADREHECDILLDQNLYERMEERYSNLLPIHCKKFLGPKYALLRPEFMSARQNLRKRDGTVKRILVFMGGADPTNETAKALEAINMLNRPELIVDVVVGHSNPNQCYIEQMCQNMPNTKIYYQVDNMAELMVQADLAIGGGGSTTWERCCVGLTGVFVSLADNQIEILSNIAKANAGIYLGSSNDTSIKDYIDALTTIFDGSILETYSIYAYQINCDENSEVIKSLLD